MLRKCFQILVKRVLSTYLVSHPGLALDLRTGWDLDDPAQSARMWSHLQRERPVLIVGSWSGLGARMTHMRWMTDVYRWQVSQGRFFVHQHSGILLLNAELCAISSVLVSRVHWWEVLPHELRKDTQQFLQVDLGATLPRTVSWQMIRGLRQALTRTCCLQALESGPTVEGILSCSNGQLRSRVLRRRDRGHRFQAV